MIFLTINHQMQGVQQAALHYSIFNHLGLAQYCMESALITQMHEIGRAHV